MGPKSHPSVMQRRIEMKFRVILLSLIAGFTVLGTLKVALPISAQDEPNPIARKATEDLGRFLFWDPILSGSRDTACATCHHPDFAYTDGRALSRGAGSVGLGPERVDTTGGAIPVVQRNAPTILNVGFNGLDEGRRRRRQQFDGTIGS